MPDEARVPARDVDVAALFEQLKEEVRRVGPAGPFGDGASTSSTRVDARSAAERLWAVHAPRHIGGRTGFRGALYRPAKLVLRRLMRWYIEPVLADQRSFNLAVLRLLDDIYEELERLQAARQLAADPEDRT